MTVRPADYPPPFAPSEAIAAPTDPASERIEVGVAIVGLEVPHLHVHLTPIWQIGDLDFTKQDQAARPDDLDRAAEQLRSALRELGCEHVAS